MSGISFTTGINGGCRPMMTEMTLFESVSAIRSGFGEMSDLICQIVTRRIYAYVAEIFGGPAFWDGKWCLMVDVIWRGNGCPIREKMVLKFDTEEEAGRVKIGTIAKDKTLYELLK